jgi:hypothetical protein
MPNLGTIADPTFWGFALAAICYFIFILFFTRGASSIVFWLLALLGAGFVFFRVAFFGVVLPVAGYIYHHPIMGFSLGAVYVLLGIAVAVTKWRSFSKIEPMVYSKPPKNVFEAEDRIKEDFKRIPKAKKYKSTISNWIGTWPVLVLDFILTTFLSGFFRTIAEKTEAIFNRVSFATNSDIVARYQELNAREAKEEEISVETSK